MIHLHPKDPDPYLDFRITDLSEANVTFQKLSSSQTLTIELQKIADITCRSSGRIADIELRGRIVLEGNGVQQRWVFMSRGAALLRYTRQR